VRESRDAIKAPAPPAPSDLKSPDFTSRPAKSPPVRSPVAPPLAAVGSLFGSLDFDNPPVAHADRPAMLETLGTEVAACRRCAELARSRTQTVFGVGSPHARLMFIGEAPGADEDRQGEPFVGRAGQLLTDMITKGMGLSRGHVYIANIIKCRPPDNRNPSLEECNNCVGYLEQQISIIRPEFLCLLGLVAAQTLLETSHSLGRLRGRWHTYRGIRTIVTYHPAFLLRSPAFKKQAWEDLQTLMKAMGLPTPKPRTRSDG
jgi:DNA polymerase